MARRATVVRHKDSPREGELRWFFDDARGEMGAHGLNPEPNTPGGERDHDGVSDRSVDSAQKYREIAEAFSRLTREHQQALRLAYSPWPPAFVREAGGSLDAKGRELASLYQVKAKLGDSARVALEGREERVRRLVERAKAKKKKALDTEAITELAAIRVEADRLVVAARTEFERGRGSWL